MKKYTLLLFALPVFLLLTGCALNRDNARVIYSAKAEGQFFDRNGGKNYNFYTYWEGSEPIAYLALDKKYQLQGRFWYETAMSAGIWKDLPNQRSERYFDRYLGMEIVSPQSEPIGYVYSKYHWVTAWFAEPGSTTVTIPPPERSGLQPDPDQKDDLKGHFHGPVFMK
jgi:hypothetical protein